MIIIEDCSKTYQKEKYFISCLSDFTRHHNQLYSNDHDGFLITEYQYNKEIFPNFLEVNKEIQSFDEDFKEMLKVCKKFKSLKRANSFVERRSDMFSNMSDCWEYSVVGIFYDYIEFEKSFTGVYNRLDHILIYNEFGNHFTSIFAHLWKYLIQSIISEDNFKEFKSRLNRLCRYMDKNDVKNPINTFSDFENIIKNDFSIIDFNHFQYFPNIPKEYYDICDKYIHDNLILKSEYSAGGGATDYYKSFMG